MPGKKINTKYSPVRSKLTIKIVSKWNVYVCLFVCFNAANTILPGIQKATGETEDDVDEIQRQVEGLAFAVRTRNEGGFKCRSVCGF